MSKNEYDFVVELLVKSMLDILKKILGEKEYRKILIKIKLNKIESEIIRLHCQINESVSLP